MSVFKPEKELIIDEILTELDFGVTSGECKATTVEKWRISERTFDRYWKEALSRFTALNLRTKKALEEVRVDAAKTRLKKAILAKEERMELLSKLANGEVLSWREVATDDGVQKLYYYSASEAKQNIAELNKMDGEYAPIKKDITSGGEKITRIDFLD